MGEPARRRSINLIADEFTANGAMQPKRLLESPSTDHAPTGPDYVFRMPTTSP